MAFLGVIIFGIIILLFGSGPSSQQMRYNKVALEAGVIGKRGMPPKQLVVELTEKYFQNWFYGDKAFFPLEIRPLFTKNFMDVYDAQVLRNELWYIDRNGDIDINTLDDNYKKDNIFNKYYCFSYLGCYIAAKVDKDLKSMGYSYYYDRDITQSVGIVSLDPKNPNITLIGQDPVELWYKQNKKSGSIKRIHDLCLCRCTYSDWSFGLYEKFIKEGIITKEDFINYVKEKHGFGNWVKSVKEPANWIESGVFTQEEYDYFTKEEQTNEQ